MALFCVARNISRLLSKAEVFIPHSRAEVSTLTRVSASLFSLKGKPVYPFEY